jgi:hypothetical protein
MENAMVVRKTVGRVVFFGLGYLAGTRAGRERYAQIEAGVKAAMEKLRARYAENATSTSASPSGRDGYSDIRLGD